MRKFAAALAALALWGTAARAQDCEDSPVPCTVSSHQGLKCAASKPNITEIIIDGPITVRDESVTCNESFPKVDNYTIESSSVDIAGHADGSLRSLTIRSVDNGGEPFTVSSAVESEGLFKCWPLGPVSILLSDLGTDGGQLVGPLVNREMNCSASLDSVSATNFVPGDAGLLTLDGDTHLEIIRSRFDDIDGAVVRAWGGLLSVTQSVFSNCGGHSGGAVVLGSAVEAEVTGTLFWGCWSGVGGGAIHATEGVSLLVEGSAFVGNAAPSGGAILWESSSSLGLIHSVFAANAASGSWNAGPVPAPDMPKNACNFEWLGDPALPSAPTEVDGTGGALTLNTFGPMSNLIKNVFIENRAGSGGAIAAQAFGDAELTDEGLDYGAWALSLTHNTFAANEAEDGAAVWLGETEAGYLVTAGNLWLEHQGEPLSVRADGWTAILTGDHTVGPPLSDGVDVPVWEYELSCGARPRMRACATGCGAEADEDLCGEVHDDVMEQWGFPSALHFGYELCPEEDGEPCEDLGEDDCGALDEPCVWQASLDDPYFQMDDGPADTGVTGLPCNLLWNWLPDSDGDHVPDYAECDVDGEPPASEDRDRHPFAEEQCNGLDDNCDGQADEGLLEEYYQDLDGDGFGGGDPILSCDPLGELFTTADDCDDTNASAHPSASEVHDDGVDNDCDGVVDLDAPGCHSAGCLATRVAPGEDGLELSFAPAAPGLLLTGLWGIGRRVRRR